jgi:DNA-binding CsgD family transcriptional regulator
VAIETAGPLLERQRELAGLGNGLTAARQGRGQVVLIEAPAGLGKTSLLSAACQTAVKAGFTCLRARASELERDFAYGCVRQLLEPVVARVSDAERDRLFEGAAALSRPLFALTGASQPSRWDDASFSVLHGLYWLLSNLADGGPVALSVDDLHWSDTESLRFLNYLASRLDGLPLAVVGSTRSGEYGAPDLARLATAPETRLLRPRPLSVEATGMLCERRLGMPVTDQFAAACWQATAGNPFFLEALLREVDEQRYSTDALGAAKVEGAGPAAVARAVLLRLAAGPAAATALVRAVAVLGDGASLSEAARLAEVDDDQAARGADLLVALGILKPGERLEFVHPIVREAVYADIGSHERAGAHARAAVLLEVSGAAEERIAAQIVQAEPTGDAGRVELLRRVGADALAKGAPVAAVAWYQRALVEPPPSSTKADVLLELGSAELRLGAATAVDHLTAAVELLSEPEPLATSARLLANALTLTGNADQAVEALASAIDILEAEDRELSLLVEGELATHALQAGLETRASVARRLERHRDLRGSTPGERLLLAGLACQRARASDTADEAAGHLEGALAGGQVLSEQKLDIVGLLFDLVLGLLATDALDVADACIDSALSESRARASIPSIAWLTDRRGWICLRRGAVEQAEADARTGLELLTSHQIPLGIPFALSLLIEVLIERGEIDAAERELRGRWAEREIPPGPTSNFLLEARGLLRLAQGRMREGVEDLLEFGRRDALWGAANPLASRWRSRASLALAAMGEDERARRMALDDLRRARRWGAASGIGVALRATALVEGGAASVDRLREAVEVLEGSPARLEHARALTDLGAALRRGNRRAEARGALTDGLDLAERCGARALAQRARTELRAAGGRPRQPRGTGVQQLTASERRVAELAAEGRSNPEIAQALFVTRKTVETHLGHVYQKLDVSGRGQLGHALAEQAPTAGG